MLASSIVVSFWVMWIVWLLLVERTVWSPFARSTRTQFWASGHVASWTRKGTALSRGVFSVGSGEEAWSSELVGSGLAGSAPRRRVFLLSKRSLVFRPRVVVRRDSHTRRTRRCFGIRNQPDLALSGRSVEGTWVVDDPGGEGFIVPLTATCSRMQQRSPCAQNGSSTCTTSTHRERPTTAHGAADTRTVM